MSLEDIFRSGQERYRDIMPYDSTQLTRRGLVKRLAWMCRSQGLCLCLYPELELGLGLELPWPPLFVLVNIDYLGTRKGKGK